MKKTVTFLLIFFCLGITEADNDRINALAKMLMQNNQLPGLAIALYDHGKPQYFMYGIANATTGKPVTNSTIFEIGSVTKTFTTTLLAMQVEAGKIKLNDAIGPYLPTTVQNEIVKQITFEQLATHTASLPKIPPGYSPDGSYGATDFIDFLNHWQPPYPIGSKWQYSNLGFGLLGYALTGVMKQNFWSALHHDLLQPLAMNNTMYFVLPELQNQYAQGYYANNEPAPRWKMTAWKPSSGALRSTPIDMMKYLQANLNIGNAPASIKQAMQFAQQNYFKINARTMQGLAWSTTVFPEGGKMIWKVGATAGFSTFIALNPDKQMGLVIMINKKTKTKELMNLAKSILLDN